MIRYTQGNLLDAHAEAVVNTVNTVGVMGKGIALMFKEAYPENFALYTEACKSGQVQVGRMFVTENKALVGPKWIINFPTKKHWRHPSKMEWVREGLVDLKFVLHEKAIQSVAVPPLGCGAGGLDWPSVREEIESALASLVGIDVLVYEPTSQYQPKAKEAGLEELTPARALISELVRRYWVLGIECTNLEVQKLAWFLERVILRMGLKNPLDLRFKANMYGPYADRLRHLLAGLDGSFLRCGKRLADATPKDTIWFDEEKKETLGAYLNQSVEEPYRNALERTINIIDGFESPLGMELLATVDWLLSQEHCEPKVEAIQQGLRSWPGGQKAAIRKSRLFDDRMIGLALDRLSRTVAV